MSSEYDFDEDGDDETVPCGYCGEMIYEDSLRCPHCGNYLSEEEMPSRAKPLWIVLAAILCLLVVLAWIFSY
jgi:predicted nucleic acid-binding Zn ribbon protein